MAANFLSKGYTGDENRFQTERRILMQLENDPYYNSVYGGQEGYGGKALMGFNEDAAIEDYIGKMQRDPSSTSTIDYLQRINEDDKFAEGQPSKMSKLAKRYLDADPKGGYGISNLEQAEALRRAQYMFGKESDMIGGAWSSANDLYGVTKAMRDTMGVKDEPVFKEPEVEVEEDIEPDPFTTAAIDKTRDFLNDPLIDEEENDTQQIAADNLLDNYVKAISKGKLA